MVQQPGDGNQNPGTGGDETGDDPQPDVDVVFNATHLYGEYYDYYGNNYCIILSDDPDLTADDSYYNLNPGCTYYFLDLYSDVEPSGTTIVLPEGEYMDYDGSVDVETGYSLYMYYGETEDDDVELYPSYASVTVTGNGIEALITLQNGLTHKVVYSGPLTLELPYGDSGYDDGYDDGDGDEDYGSTLTDDLQVSSDECDIYADYYGDGYEVGIDNWVLHLISPEGDYLMFDLLTPSDGFAGTYSIDDSFEVNTSVPGFVSYGYTFGSWYFFYADSDNLSDMAPLFNGTLTVDYDETTGMCTAEFECCDELNNKVSGIMSGLCEVTDVSEEYVSYAKQNRSSSHKVFKPARTAPRTGKFARVK